MPDLLSFDNSFCWGEVSTSGVTALNKVSGRVEDLAAHSVLTASGSWQESQRTELYFVASSPSLALKGFQRFEATELGSAEKGCDVAPRQRFLFMEIIDKKVGS